jgi:Na+/H+ antiporter NhaD/arsenite permease-like protein
MLVAIGIFMASYVLIILEKLNRALVALAGGTMMVLFHFVPFEEAYRDHIEWDLIILLIGMMILVGITNRSGVFQYIAIKTSKLVGGRPTRLLLLLCALTAIGSAFLDNVTTVMLMVPITFSITRILQVNPVPYLISEIIAANIGGAATLIGDPPKLMIGAANPHLTFNDFLIQLGPATLIVFVVSMGMLYWGYRHELRTRPEFIEELMKLDASKYIRDRALMIKSVSILMLTIMGFISHSWLHLDAALIAFSGAVLLTLIGIKEEEVEEAFRSIEWLTLFFFAGLFVLVAGLINVGVIEKLAESAIDWTDGNIPVASMLILWASGIFSAVIDNIPFVATMIPIIQNMGIGMGLPPQSELMDPIWWSLALGACLGGNGSLVGASSNLIVAGMAAKEGQPITYLQYLKAGVPITIASLIVATFYVWFVYLADIAR